VLKNVVTITTITYNRN